MISYTADSEYRILENIYDSSGQNAPLRQRDLASITGISLGMTNSILRRLAQKGWITMRKLNRRTIRYAITLDGINEMVRRSYRYFKRTIENVVAYKERITGALYLAKRRNIATVLLIGTSDLDFIVEYGCHLCGMDFVKIPDEKKARKALGDDTLAVYAEGIPRDAEGTPGDAEGTPRDAEAYNALYLSQMVLQNPRAARHGSEA
jgi:DNA-binding MarR family transcriptional regulator